MNNAHAPAASADSVGPLLGRIPSGLFIVTWREGDADRTMLTSWLMQAGFEPPAISIAVGRDRQFLKAASGDLRFVVNQLADSQRSLLGRFGKPVPDGQDPFAGIAISRSPCGAAVLPDTVGWMECHGRPLPAEPAATSEGDHQIVIGDVTVAGTGPADAPLVHLRKSGLHY